MAQIMTYAAPIVLILLTFTLKPLRLWLEKLSTAQSRLGEMAESFQTHTSKFLRLTDPEGDAELRGLLRWMGSRMMEGTFLIDGLVLMKQNGSEFEGGPGADLAMSRLSPEARHAFGQALGAALIVSACQSVWRRRKYLAILGWLVTPHGREVKEPEQVIYRYRRATHLPNVQVEHV